MSVDARKERFELVEVFDRPMLFTCLRVDRNTVPKGLYLYEVRNDDDQCGIPVEIGRWIMVNHWGTLLSATPIKLEPNRYNNNAYRHIDPENDWNYTGELCSAREYMDKYLLKKFFLLLRHKSMHDEHTYLPTHRNDIEMPHRKNMQPQKQSIQTISHTLFFCL